MNILLIEALSLLNAILAAAIIGTGAAGGYFFADQTPDIEPVAGLILGGLAGLIVAAIFCGVIAAIVQTERHLRVLAKNSG